MKFTIIEVFVQHVRETGYKCVSGHSRVTGHCTLKTIFDDLITEWSWRLGGQTGKKRFAYVWAKHEVSIDLT